MKVILALAASTTLLLTACSTEQAYNTVQAWQRNQCNKIPDNADYDRCMRQTQTPYDSYKQQTEQHQQ